MREMELRRNLQDGLESTLGLVDELRIEVVFFGRRARQLIGTEIHGTETGMATAA